MACNSLTSSVPSPLQRACKNTSFYYEPGTSLPALNMLEPSYERALASLSPACKAFLRVQFFFNLRYAELSNVRVADSIGADRYLVRGAKRSRASIVYLPGLSAQLENIPESERPEKVFNVEYIVLYRQLRRAGCGYSRQGYRNIARTHTSRYSLAHSVNALCGSSAAGECLHHQSKTAVDYYLKERVVPNGCHSKRYSRAS